MLFAQLRVGICVELGNLLSLLRPLPGTLPCNGKMIASLEGFAIDLILLLKWSSSHKVLVLLVEP